MSFQFNGERIQQSAQTSNKDAARQIEAPHRVRLAKGEAGTLERPPASTLKEFSPRFESAIVTLCAGKPATVRFYQEKSDASGGQATVLRTPERHRRSRY